MRSLFLATALACAGCAVLSNVTPTGGDAYMTVTRSNDVNGRVADEQARAMSQRRRSARSSTPSST